MSNEKFLFTMCVPMGENLTRILTFATHSGITLAEYDDTKKPEEQSNDRKLLTVDEFFELCKKHYDENDDLKFTPEVSYGAFTIQYDDVESTMIHVMNEGVEVCLCEADKIVGVYKITYQQMLDCKTKLESQDFREKLKSLLQHLPDTLFEQLPAKEA